MPEPGAGGRLRRLDRATVLAVMAWTVVVIASLAWNLYNTWETSRDLARREAVAHFNKDQAIRYWASRHGGVYVEVDANTPPNPALEHIPERDLTTPSGRHLTLMNPAYMLRQVMDDYAGLYGIRGRITSLLPLNPDNAADPWEEMALKRFETGERQVFEFVTTDGEPYLRLMQAMITEQSCLKCHGHQGYEVGDVRGGVGIALPLAPYQHTARIAMAIQSLTHAVIWLVGVGGIVLVGMRFRALAAEDVAEQARIAVLHHRLELVLGAVSDGIVGMDQKGAVKFANPAAAAILGYGAGELLDRDLHETVNPPGEPGRILLGGVDSGRIGKMFRRKDGTLVPVELAVSPVSEEGQPVGAVVVFRDVSERLEGERRSRELMEKLAQSNQDLQQFAYSVSHDLQEPLRMVGSYLQLLSRRLGDGLDGDCREFIGFAVDGAARMSRMIADLVEFSRVESRAGPMSQVDVNQVVDDALANLAVAIEDSGADIQVDRPLPAVMGDTSQLERLFQNLVGNAIKFRSPDRPPHIQINAVIFDGMAEFRVSDNGIGIPADSFERIFQVFQRLHSRDRYEGSGIGLAVVRRIVERHGGRVWVESREGVGSVFHLTLPLSNLAASGGN